jgi:hypothetical protein
MRSDIEFWASKFLVPWPTMCTGTESVKWAKKIETYDMEMIPVIKGLSMNKVPFSFLVNSSYGFMAL